MTVRVRIAPSPTGDPHVGTAYIALFNLAFARRFNGKFILRVEDTDQKRSEPEYEENIYKSLKWCGIEWDEGPDVGGPFGPYRQSERTEIYRRHAEMLLKRGTAYKCFATPEELAEIREKGAAQGLHIGYDRRCRDLSIEEVKRREDRGESYVVRLKVPLTGECVYEDALRGRISCPWADVDDQILLKSDGFPTYHLAAVVDDHLMEISHVIRGDDWMTSTPKHVSLYEAFGWTPPIFMHMPLLLGKDGRKLSKRRNPTSIFYFRDSGYLSSALLNFLSLMGYSMPDEREKYSLDEFIAEFDPKRIGISGAYFDIQKLDWLNKRYIIESMSHEELWNQLEKWSFNREFMMRLMPLIHERLKTFGDFISLCDFFFVNDLHLTADRILPKNVSPETGISILQCLIWSFDGDESFEDATHQVTAFFDVHHKKVVMPLLFATIMGKSHGPPLYDSVAILGKDRSRVRLMQAIEILGGISNKKMEELKKRWESRTVKTISDR